MRAGEIINLPVIEASSNKILGKVKELIFDFNKGLLEAFLFKSHFIYRVLSFPSVELRKDSLLVPLSSISFLFLNKDIKSLLIKNRSFSKQVFDEKGERVGEIDEIYINPKNGRIKKIEVSRGFLEDLTEGSLKISFEDIISWNEKLIVSSLKLPKKVSFFKKVSEKVKELESKTYSFIIEEEKKLLLGKKAKVKLLSESGEKIIDKGEVITEEILERVEKEGKVHLLSLFHFSDGFQKSRRSRKNLS